jgi:hypothetical protein
MALLSTMKTRLWADLSQKSAIVIPVIALLFCQRDLDHDNLGSDATYVFPIRSATWKKPDIVEPGIIGILGYD